MHAPETAGTIGVAVGVVMSGIGVRWYWKGTQAKQALEAYKELDDANTKLIRQLRSDVDALKASNAALAEEVRHLKKLPLESIKSNQDTAMVLLTQIATTQTQLMHILASHYGVEVPAEVAN